MEMRKSSARPHKLRALTQDIILVEREEVITRHAQQRMATRVINTRAMNDAVSHGDRFNQGNRKQLVLHAPTNMAVVIDRHTNTVITVINKADRWIRRQGIRQTPASRSTPSDTSENSSSHIMGRCRARRERCEYMIPSDAVCHFIGKQGCNIKQFHGMAGIQGIKIKQHDVDFHKVIIYSTRAESTAAVKANIDLKAALALAIKAGQVPRE